MIKVTMNEDVESKKPIDYTELPQGTVVELSDGVKAIVYSGKETKKELLLIEYGNPDYLLCTNNTYTDCYPIVKVLGMVKEIIVEQKQ